MVRKGGLEPPQHNATRSLVLRVYQFRHFRSFFMWYLEIIRNFDGNITTIQTCVNKKLFLQLEECFFTCSLIYNIEINVLDVISIHVRSLFRRRFFCRFRCDVLFFFDAIFSVIFYILFNILLQFQSFWILQQIW